MSPRPHACFGMYPFKPIRWAWEALIEAVHDEVPWVPGGLDWSERVHDAWRDPSCVLAHACGWPVAAQLTDQVRVAGAFSLTVPDTDGHRYRSVVLATRPGLPQEFARPGVVAGANSPDSLSGWVSLVTAIVGAGGRWPGDVVWTHAHAASVRALLAREIDLACIDGWSLAHLRRIDPSITDRVFEIGYGPWIPSPAVVVRSSATDAQVDEIRAAMTRVLQDPARAELLEALMIDGFVPLDEAEYRPLVALTPSY